MNQLTKVINAKNETTEIAYDLNGNTLSMKDGKGNIMQYEYNVVGKPVKRIDPGGKDGSSYVTGRFESYSYRADGSLASKIDRKGQSFTYTYDVFGRMTKKEAGTAQVSYEYDKNDNLTKMTDATGSTVRKYDELDRCIEKTVPTIGKLTYQYDVTTGVADGFKGEKTIDPKGNSTLKVYDKTGKLNAVTAETGTTNYDYYDNGSQKKVTLPNGVTSEYTYDADSRLKTLANKKDATVIEQYSYDYDATGNMTKKKDKKGDTAYEYDQLNRIQKVTEPGSKVTSYTYDAAGNRASETANGKTYQYTYDNRNRLTQVDATSDAVKKVFEYDNNGNQIKQKDVTKSTNAESVIQENTYDAWNQLTQTKAGSTTVKNTYNGDGLRTAKDVNGQSTQYLYEFDKVVLETDNSGNQTSRNVYGTNLISKTNGADTYNYIYNGHGDVTGLTDSSGTVKASYYYDAFGNITEQTGTVNNGITYAGYQYDKESGLYYLNSRMYDPKTARFMQEDTYRGDNKDPLSLNLYTYCHNEPMMYTDPSGHYYVYNTYGGANVATWVPEYTYASYGGVTVQQEVPEYTNYGGATVATYIPSGTTQSWGGSNSAYYTPKPAPKPNPVSKSTTYNAATIKLMAAVTKPQQQPTLKYLLENYTTVPGVGLVQNSTGSLYWEFNQNLGNLYWTYGYRDGIDSKKTLQEDLFKIAWKEGWKQLSNYSINAYNYLHKKAPVITGILDGLAGEVKSLVEMAGWGWRSGLGGLITDPGTFDKQWRSNAEVAINILKDPKAAVHGSVESFGKYIKSDVINGNAHTRSEFGTHLVVFVASLFVGVGEAKAGQTTAKVAVEVGKLKTVTSVEKFAVKGTGEFGGGLKINLQLFAENNQYVKTSLWERLTTKKLSIDKLVGNPKDEFMNPKIGPSGTALSKHMNHIKQNGKIDEPILVKKLTDGTYEIQNGHHRWLAAQKMGLKNVPVEVMK